MKKSKRTRASLLSSVIALTLCFAMLLGTTFAWFTDTATTAVNSIQAGTLDVDLVFAEEYNGLPAGTSAVGKTLDFKKAAGATGEEVLWEPGCTYELPALKVVNKGNLALKYKIVLTGIDGDAELNEAIEWTMGGVDLKGNTEYSLAAMTGDTPTESEPFTISGHMKEEAGNEYQGLTIDGIAITVYATQLGGELDGVNGENDSVNNTYDEGAAYPVEIIPEVKEQVLAPVTDPGGETVSAYTYANSDRTITATVPAAAVASEGAAPTLTVKPTAKNAGSVSIAAGEQDAVAYDVSIANATLTSETPATVELFVGKNLTGVVLYHHDDQMELGTAGSLTDGQYVYNAGTGYVTFVTSSFSPFTIVFDSPVAVAGGVSYYDLQSALDAGGEVFLQKDVVLSATAVVTERVVLNLNGKTISNTGDIWIDAVSAWSLISVRNGGDLTINGTGTLRAKENDCYAVDLMDGGVCTINGGEYIGNISAVYVYKGGLTVNGGSFSIQQPADNVSPYKFTLNCYDSARGDGTATISVTGGTFYGFDPANCEAEGPGTNFVSEGYVTVQDGDWYTVVPGAYVSTAEELTTAVANAKAGDIITLRDNINLNETLQVAKSITIDGGNFILTGLSGNPTIKVTGTVDFKLKNISIERETYVATDGVQAATAAGSTLSFENVTISNHFKAIHFLDCRDTDVVIKGGTYTSVYPFNVNGGSIKSFKATDAAFNGWTSFAANPHNSVYQFERCSFGEGSGYATVKPYASATFTECVFSADYFEKLKGGIATGTETPITLNFNGCKVLGAEGAENPLTAETLKEMFNYDISSGSNSGDSTINDQYWYIDGTKLELTDP